MSIAFKLGQLARRTTIVTSNAAVGAYSASHSAGQALVQGWKNPEAAQLPAPIEAADLSKLTKAQLIALLSA